MLRRLWRNKDFKRNSNDVMRLSKQRRNARRRKKKRNAKKNNDGGKKKRKRELDKKSKNY